ncbi:MAG: glycoside hydrolase family 3 N-terminal domain-containing protein [Candidatus Cyclobacteriaceae bacterium M2_1C_046]
MSRAFLYIFILAGTLFFTKAKSQQNPEYLNVDLSFEERVDALVNSLTLQEKIGQLTYNSPAIDRLDIPAYNWWNEALHGVGRAGVATIFPQAIGLGATFDEELILRVSSAISDEARAMYNASVDKGYHMKYGGLTFWTPNINIFRDPRWGRGQETYGEDPYLTSVLGKAFVNGLQGDHPKYLKTAACAKHYAVHSGPEKLRHEFNAEVSKKDLYETYLPAFEALVTEAKVEAVMCAYNSTNGEPCCANKYLLEDVLRDKWGFKGHVVSDCWALVDFYNGHNVVENEAQAAALAIKSGINLNCGSVYAAALEQAVKDGLVEEAVIDENLKVLLRTKFKLGLFDPEEENPYNDISTEVINSEKHRQLAREAAQKSIVLLKNNGVLPLKKDLSMYFVTGPNASSVDALLGNYYGINPNMVTILEGLSAKIEPGSQMQYRMGALLDRENVNPQDWTTGNAKIADATFVVMGLTGLLEGEEGESIASPYFGDRLDYNLPQNQINFLKKIREGHSQPVIAIITGGSPMNLAEVQEIADAVVLAWYPGAEGGNAVADIVFGDVSPSGRLPITFPKSLDQLPPYEDYSMKGRTYRYMSEDPLYPFGFGLSYASFNYDDLKFSSKEIKKGESLNVEATITNIGKLEGEEVVQLYIHDMEADVDVPLYSLKEIKRIKLAPGASETVRFTVTPEMMNIINKEGNEILEKGNYKIFIAGAAPHKRSVELGAPEPLTGIFSIN